MKHTVISPSSKRPVRNNSLSKLSNREGIVNKPEPLTKPKPATVRPTTSGNASTKNSISKDNKALTRTIVSRRLPMTILRMSALDLSMPSEGASYSYRVGPGNNSGLIYKMLKARWWWSKSSDEALFPNFIWSQGRDKPYLRSMESSEDYTMLENTMNSEILPSFVTNPD